MKKKQRPGRGRKALVWLLLLGLAGLFTYEALTWPDVKVFTEQNPRTTAFIERYQARQRRAGKTAEVAWQWTPYDQISNNLKRAVLVSEDISFFHHHGFEAPEIRSAVQEAWEEREWPRGASTLTQQVAKNLWLSPSRNPARKLKEAILTIQLERNLSKKRIFEIYLNVAEFGPGIYGAEAASRAYFNQSADRLSETQAAQLAAGLPKPSTWHPGSESRAYNKKVTIILQKMAGADFLEKRI